LAPDHLAVDRIPGAFYNSWRKVNKINREINGESMSERSFQISDLIENRYKVLAVINSGGMGTLYRVSDEIREGQILGLKTVPLNIQETASAEYFQREFRILTQMRHPNLVSVFDFGITI
jgi:serine/threonine protein kinase